MVKKKGEFPTFSLHWNWLQWGLGMWEFELKGWDSFSFQMLDNRVYLFPTALFQTLFASNFYLDFWRFQTVILGLPHVLKTSPINLPNTRMYRQNLWIGCRGWISVNEFRGWIPVDRLAWIMQWLFSFGHVFFILTTNSLLLPSSFQHSPSSLTIGDPWKSLEPWRSSLVKNLSKKTFCEKTC